MGTALKILFSGDSMRPDSTVTQQHRRSKIPFQLVRGDAVDDVHREMFAPAMAPIWFVKTFHDEDEFANVLRHGSEQTKRYGIAKNNSSWR